MIKAKINDDAIDMITVSAKPPTNSTLEPSPVTIGIKAKTVVAVAAANGAVMFSKVSLIDSFIDKPIDLLYL